MDSFQAAVLAIRLTRLDGWNVARAGRAAHHTELLECSSYSCHRIFPIQRAYVLDTLTRDLIQAIDHVLRPFTARSPRRKQSSDRTTLGSPLRAILKSNLTGVQPYE